MKVQTVDRGSARSAAAFFILVANSGCRVAQCPPLEPIASVVAEQGTTDPPRVVRGRVLNVDVIPLAHARVRLREADSTWSAVDSAGTFLFQVPRAGTYTLEVSARDYDSAIESVALRPESGLRVVAVLVRSTTARRRSRACVADTAQLSSEDP